MISKIVLLGRSAGAHLALLAAYGERTLAIRGVVAWYGPWIWPTAGAIRRRPIRSTCERSSRRSSAARRPSGPTRTRAASPLTYVSQTSPATLLLDGSRDHIVEARFGRALHARLRAAGATSILLELPWAEHAFDLVPNGLSGQLALYYTEEFLAAVCAGTS